MCATQGFTLIEMIIYIAVVAVLLTLLAGSVVNILRVRAKNQAASHVQYNARLMLDRLSEASRHAEAVNIGTSTFGSDPGVLSFDMVDLLDDPTVFSLTSDDGAFQVSIAGAAAEQVTTDDVSVTNFTLTNLTSTEDLGIIQVEFTVETVNASGSPLYDYAQSFQTALRIPLDD